MNVRLLGAVLVVTVLTAASAKAGVYDDCDAAMADGDVEAIEGFADEIRGRIVIPSFQIPQAEACVSAADGTPMFRVDGTWLDGSERAEQEAIAELAEQQAIAAATITEALPRCIELAEGFSQFGLAFQSAMDEMGETTYSRDLAILLSSAVLIEAYVDRLVPLLEEEASHDRLIDELSTIEMKRSNLQEFIANMIEETFVGGDDYSDKAQFISQCAQGAFDLPE